MATESTIATVTLVKGPTTFRVREYIFKQGTSIQIPITPRTESLLARLRSDKNFSVKMPSKKAAEPVKAGKSKKSTPPPKVEVDEDESEEELEEDESEEEGEEDESEEETEEKTAEYARAKLKDLSKADLLKIAKKLKVKGVTKQLSRSAITDAIMQAQGGE